MNRVMKVVLTSSVAAIGALLANGGEDRYDTVNAYNDYQSASGSFADIPAGAHVLAEASAVAPGSSAYAAASGGGANVSKYVTYNQGGDDEAFTYYSSTVSYDIWASGSGYALVDIEWGY